MPRTLTLIALALAATITQAQGMPAPAVPTPPVPTALQGPVTFTCEAKKGKATILTPTTLVTATNAGWDLHSVPTIADGVCTSATPFYFSIPLPEGNYQVTAVLGGKEASVVTVRAEARRLMLEKVPVKANGSLIQLFNVNLRVPEFIKPDGTPGKVRLKAREIGNLDWDTKLTLEFNGDHPSFRSLTIEPLTGLKSQRTIYLAGDSTMVDQDVEPWASWGQMLPRFFVPGVVVANHAESGEASNSFVGEQRFAKIMSLIKPGDFFFVQFGHNDQKIKDFLPQYKVIMTKFVTDVRDKGATPVIVTAMNRDEFDEAGHIRDTLAGYPEAAREVAAATNTALIDLNAMSKTMFEAMGHDGADKAFMHFAANTFPGQTAAISDNTHFNDYGAYELARCVVQGIRDNKLTITRYLDPGVPPFNPAKPDPFAGFHLPFTPIQTKEDTTKIPQANLN